MKKINIKNKNTIIIGIISLLGIIAIITGVVLLLSNNNKKLENKLGEIGKHFYENLYYAQITETVEDKTKFFKKYEKEGLKINLNNLLIYNEEEQVKISKSINKKLNNCDKEKTKVIIYPEKPYDKTSYKLEIKLKCN